MLLIFWRTNTRVTLETAIPPSTDDDEADEAEIVLGALEVLAYLLLPITVGAHAHELRSVLCLKLARQRVDLRLGHAQQHLARDAAAKRDETGLLEIVVVDKHARPQAECTQRAAGLE